LSSETIYWTCLSRCRSWEEAPPRPGPETRDMITTVKRRNNEERMKKRCGIEIQELFFDMMDFHWRKG
jgi:hypothetical protein